jgi:uncharacterized protein (DUF1330 family)
MPAYVIVEIEVTEPVEYEEYRKVVPPTLAAYGGRFVVRGGEAEGLEGGWDPKRIVVLEFESVERAKEWWASEEYAEPKAMRQRSSNGRMIVVAGVDGGS